MNERYQEKIIEALPYCLSETALAIGPKYQGKVRDVYDLGDRLLLISTDRQSAFDRLLGAIPYKGQVLNQSAAWWFEQTAHIVNNHLIDCPDPNVSIVKKAAVYPLEFVVRGYITGSTKTALWTQYQAGHRNYCGNDFPEGLIKNQPLDEPVLTPTTKGVDEDRPISPDEIIASGLMTAEEWEEARDRALALFAYGSNIAAQHGLILVDTKYEFAKDENNQLLLVDEIHTPDSSRFWMATTYQERFRAGLEPENIDKEFFRLWFAEHSDPYHDKILPEAPQALICELSRRYIQLYEMITGQSFQFPNRKQQILARIMENIQPWIAR